MLSLNLEKKILNLIFTQMILLKHLSLKNSWPSNTFEIGGGISTVNVFGEDLKLYQFSVDKKVDPLKINFDLMIFKLQYTTS